MLSASPTLVPASRASRGATAQEQILIVQVLIISLDTRARVVPGVERSFSSRAGTAARAGSSLSDWEKRTVRAHSTDSGDNGARSRQVMEVVPGVPAKNGLD